MRAQVGFVAARLGSGDSLLETFSGATLSAILFLYTSVASVTAQLLHCVNVDGIGHRLFLGASVKCYSSFQLAVFVVAGLPVILFPVGLLVWHARERDKHEGKCWRYGRLFFCVSKEETGL